MFVDKSSPKRLLGGFPGSERHTTRHSDSQPSGGFWDWRYRHLGERAGSAFGAFLKDCVAVGNSGDDSQTRMPAVTLKRPTGRLGAFELSPQEGYVGS
jgi:hypothetical protein